MRNHEEANGAAHAAAAAPMAGGGARAAEGAPPSITAPANCIMAYRHGIDSLYLSFRGGIHPRWALRLQEAKEFAQASDEHLIAAARVRIGDHDFLVAPRGRGRFAFLLEDNWFSIQLSNATKGVLPLALVQVRSEYLTAVGPDEAVSTVSAVVERLGEVDGPALLSRIDLFADFGSSVPLAEIPGRHWVKRAKKRAIHEECDEITGITFGAGNEVSARLYDKTRELLRSGKDYMKPLWTGGGWDGESPIWRMEFQVRREGLPDAMLGPAEAALGYSGQLWRYLSEEWLRLAIPSDSDETRSRWLTHPVWSSLSQVWDVDPEAPPLRRVPKTRAPTDDYLFKMGLAGLTSFMAREGITHLDEGLGEFLQALQAYWDDPIRQLPESLNQYANRKARLKARRYNVRLDGHDED